MKKDVCGACGTPETKSSGLTSASYAVRTKTRVVLTPSMLCGPCAARHKEIIRRG